MRKAAWIAIVVAACSGGGGNPGEIDAPTDGTSGCGDCDAPDPDAAATCSSLHYVARPIATIGGFGGGERVVATRSFRVALGYDALPCDQDAMPTWRIDAADHAVTFQAHVFAPPVPCTDQPGRRVLRVITLRLEAGTWRMIGAGAVVPPEATIVVGAPPPIPCTPGPGSCDQDCDCRDGLVCLDGVGLGGPFRACARPCELDRDCGVGRCTSVEDGLQQVCDASVDECDPQHACPAGYACAIGACEPDFVLSSTTRHACACDADCEAPLRCVESAIAGRVARCEIACPTGGAWCQGLHACGPASADASGLAPSDSVCGFLGE